MAKRRSAVSFDWILLSIFLSIVAIGWLMLYSSSYEGPGFWFELNSTIGRQTLWLALSSIIFVAIMNLDWRIWDTLAYPIYIISIISLVAVLFLGKEVKGASSWFSILGYSIQPSEFAKIGTALALSSFLGNTNINLDHTKNIIIAFAIFLFPSFLVFLQPDAGTAAIYFAFLIPLFRAGLNASLYIIAFSLAFIFIGSLMWGPEIMVLLIMLGAFFFMSINSKENRLPLSMILLLALICLSSFRYINYALLVLLLILSSVYFSYLLFKEGKYKNLIVISAVGISSIVLSFGTQFAFDNLLKPHQQARLNVWLKPHLSDPQGELYNIIQSKTAIGSGGFSGKGYLNGSMTKLNYVPEQNTDFVFSILGEEQGFLGSISLIILFTILLFRISMIAERANFAYIRYYAYSVAGLIFLHFFINIGMTMGLMPVIGIPLPLISKGGSSLMAFFIMMAILLKLDLARARN